jgi:hypothetical protein
MKRITWIIVIGIVVIIAIAPWIRIPDNYNSLITKNCPVSPDDDGSCLYNPYHNTGVIHLPFVVIVKNNVPPGWPGIGPSTPSIIIVTALNTVHKIK